MKGTCYNTIKQLYDYIVSINNKSKIIQILKELDSYQPVCAEDHCSYIQEFLSMKLSNLTFNFNQNANHDINLNNAFTYVSKYLCNTNLNNKAAQNNLSNNCYSMMFKILTNKYTNKRKSQITKIEILEYLLEYGQYQTCKNKDLDLIVIDNPLIKKTELSKSLIEKYKDELYFEDRKITVANTGNSYVTSVLDSIEFI